MRQRRWFEGLGDLENTWDRIGVARAQEGMHVGYGNENPYPRGCSG